MATGRKGGAPARCRICDEAFPADLAEARLPSGLGATTLRLWVDAEGGLLMGEQHDGSLIASAAVLAAPIDYCPACGRPLAASAGEAAEGGEGR